MARKEGITDEMIMEMYNSKKYKTSEMAEFAGISPRAIRNILYKHGVKRVRHGRRQYKVNEDFFKAWNNEMAYVLGMVASDGCITINKETGGQSLSISQKDPEILIKIRDVMRSNVEVKKREGDSVWTLHIYSVDLVEQLGQLGVFQDKAKNMSMPKVPPEYMSHFMRGVIDGDGWIQDRGYTMNITGISKRFIYDVCNLFKLMGLKSRIRQSETTSSGNTIYRAFVSGRDDILRMADWLYKDSGNLYLQRKKDRFYVNRIQNLAS